MFPNKAENKGKRKWMQCPFWDGRLHTSDFKIGQSKHEVPLRYEVGPAAPLHSQ
jgi:hypothetical protein